MKEKILNLFEEIANREEEIKDIKSEIKDSINIFREEHDEFEEKAIQVGYRFFKNLAKDKSSAVDQEFQRDKIVECLIKKD